jgi:hypothetical protein
MAYDLADAGVAFFRSDDRLTDELAQSIPAMALGEVARDCVGGAELLFDVREDAEDGEGLCGHRQCCTWRVSAERTL